MIENKENPQLKPEQPVFKKEIPFGSN